VILTIDLIKMRIIVILNKINFDYFHFYNNLKILHSKFLFYNNKIFYFYKIIFIKNE